MSIRLLFVDYPVFIFSFKSCFMLDVVVDAVCDAHAFLQTAVTAVDQRVALFINLRQSSY